MQSVMNLKIKFRESFRPFAPIVLREYAAEYFEMRPDEDSPYMLLVAPVRAEHRRTDVTASRRCGASIELKLAPFDDPGRDARRLLRARADALTPRATAAFAVCSSDFNANRLPGADQH